MTYTRQEVLSLTNLTKLVMKHCKVGYMEAAGIRDEAIKPMVVALLERIEKEVIGLDEKLKPFELFRDHKVIRNHLRMKQRQKLSAIKDSL